VDRQYLFDRFRLHQNAAFDAEVKAQWHLARETFVLDYNGLLAGTVESPNFEFLQEAPFVNGLDQSGTFVAMNFNGCGDDCFR
jgi:hypothetical protein